MSMQDNEELRYRAGNSTTICDGPGLSMATRSDAHVPGVKFSEVFPDIQFTEVELDRTFLTARLVRAINLDVAKKFTFPAFELCEMDEYSTEPEITGRPVRGVLSRRAKVHKGWFHLVCTDDIVAWESVPELQALTVVDCMPGISSITTQPLTVEYDCPVKHRRRVAHPDIYANLNGDPFLLEIKKDFNRLKPEDVVQYVLLEKLFERAGVRYHGWDESGICTEPAFGNAHWLGRFKSIRLRDADRLAILQLFESEPIMRLRRVSEHLADSHQMRSFAMILRGWLMPERGASVRDDPLVAINASLKGSGHESSR